MILTAPKEARALFPGALVQGVTSVYSFALVCSMVPFQRQLKGNISTQEFSDNRELTEQKQQLRPYTNGNLHKLMEVFGSRNSEEKCDK